MDRRQHQQRRRQRKAERKRVRENRVRKPKRKQPPVVWKPTNSLERFSEATPSLLPQPTESTFDRAAWGARNG